MFRQKIQSFHLIGIGGIGMSAIARVLLQMGYRVSGSDLRFSKITQELESLGAKIYEGHSPENIDGAQVVVYSSAISDKNPELIRAKELGLSVIGRGEMLAELFRIGESIAVSGSHGKTTTTSMIAHVFQTAGFDPTVIVGGVLKSLGSNAKLGKDKLIIGEADESDGSFLKLLPTVSVITNIDSEHIEFYGSFNALKEAFFNFASQVPFYGFCVLNLDDEHCKDIARRISRKVITYGFGKDCEYRAEIRGSKEGRFFFEVFKSGEGLGVFELPVAGIHNVYNALACIGVCMEANIKPEMISRALKTFPSVKRRMEMKARLSDCVIFDDYAHHPTEINAVLEALKSMYPDRKIIPVIQPHRYSRTYALFDKFVEVLKGFDCIITEIYPAGEENKYNISSLELAKRANCKYVPSKEELFEVLDKNLDANKVIVFMGAGSISRWCEEFISGRC
ncbi:MAG: UDP-N-acetylmuramate--L-alanine ligase [Aquificaceae bacterium]